MELPWFSSHPLQFGWYIARHYFDFHGVKSFSNILSEGRMLDLEDQFCNYWRSKHSDRSKWDGITHGKGKLHSIKIASFLTMKYCSNIQHTNTNVVSICICFCLPCLDDIPLTSLNPFAPNPRPRDFNLSTTSNNTIPATSLNPSVPKKSRRRNLWFSRNRPSSAPTPPPRSTAKHARNEIPHPLVYHIPQVSHYETHGRPHPRVSLLHQSAQGARARSPRYVEKNRCYIHLIYARRASLIQSFVKLLGHKIPQIENLGAARVSCTIFLLYSWLGHCETIKLTSS